MFTNRGQRAEKQAKHDIVLWPSSLSKARVPHLIRIDFKASGDSRFIT